MGPRPVCRGSRCKAAGRLGPCRGEGRAGARGYGGGWPCCVGPGGRPGQGGAGPRGARKSLSVPSRSQPMPGLAASWSSSWPLKAGCRLGLRHLEPYSVGRTLSAGRETNPDLACGSWPEPTGAQRLCGLSTSKTLPSRIHLPWAARGGAGPEPGTVQRPISDLQPWPQPGLDQKQAARSEVVRVTS